MSATPKSVVVPLQPRVAHQQPPVYFLYPPGVSGDGIPQTVERFEYRPGVYVWTVNTYGHLCRMGFPCYLTDRLPEEGIIVTHRQSLRNHMVPGPRHLFVCVVADFYRHPFAQLHLVQNRRDPMLVQPSRAWPAEFVPHWAETQLIPRDPARAETFTNVSYFGLPKRLAPQLRSPAFAASLREHGFNFRIIDRHHWNDYSDTDAVLAVRSFARVSFDKFPASKLYNSWIAGVPALLGRESAFQAERRSDYDYFEVGSAAEVLATLLRLRADPALRAAVSRNCAERAAEITSERMARDWINFLTTKAAPAYAAWRRRSSLQRATFLISRTIRYMAFVCADFAARTGRYVRLQLRALRP